MDNYFQGVEEKLFSKKNIITYLMLAIVALAIPLGVKLVQTQQTLKSRAATGNEIKFVPKTGELECTSDRCTTTKPEVQVEIQAPADSEFK